MDLHPMESSTAKGGKLPLPFPFAFFIYLLCWRLLQEKVEKTILTESSGTWVVLEGLGVSGVWYQQYLSMGEEILYRSFLKLLARQSSSVFEQDRFVTARLSVQKGG
jgi:hypothetical protein